jgi:hypothetical protein
MTRSLLPIDGTFLETPFPRLLFRIWRQESSGRLNLQKGEEAKSLHIENGRIVIEKTALSEKEFLSALVKKKVLPPEKARQCDRYAGAHMISRIKALSDLGLISPLPLWNLIESFFVRQLFSFFDWEEGRFSFESGASLPGGERLGFLQTHDLILQGVRQMRNVRLIEQHLPAEEDPIYVSSPYFLHKLNFEPHEKYVLDVLHHALNLKGFHGLCEIGKKESQKTLFAFVCMDILAVPEKRGQGRPDDQAKEPPAAEPERVLDALNEKCAYIHKYITKQIGPLAHTILGNCLEEIRPGLGPLFKKMRLLPDGRIEVDSAVTATASHLPEELFKSLRKGYDEILVAEVLAVKKSLGGAHETTLVKNMEKIGCL